MARILIVDDELAILRVLRTGLQARGHEVVTAQTGEAGLAEAALRKPDAIVLDLGLPDLDGVEVCRRIREWTQTPIIVLSAHGTESRKVQALDEGADDFITKPFSMEELQARLRVALRHGTVARGGPEIPAIDVGPLHVDLAAREVRVRDVPVELTPRQFDFLAFLARNVGKVVTHRTILEAVWGPEYGTEAHYLRVYARNVRMKIEDDPSHPTLLRTSPGVGYQLVAPDEERSRPSTPGSTDP